MVIPILFKGGRDNDLSNNLLLGCKRKYFAKKSDSRKKVGKSFELIFRREKVSRKVLGFCVKMWKFPEILIFVIVLWWSFWCKFSLDVVWWMHFRLRFCRYFSRLYRSICKTVFSQTYLYYGTILLNLLIVLICGFCLAHVFRIIEYIYPICSSTRNGFLHNSHSPIHFWSLLPWTTSRGKSLYSTWWGGSA